MKRASKKPDFETPISQEKQVPNIFFIFYCFSNSRSLFYNMRGDKTSILFYAF